MLVNTHTHTHTEECTREEGSLHGFTHSRLGMVYNRTRNSESATEGILSTVDGISESVCHDLLTGILRELHHEHTGLRSNVPTVWRACNDYTMTVMTTAALSGYWRLSVL